MPARVAPVSLWTDTGAVRCVTKAFSACTQRKPRFYPANTLLHLRGDNWVEIDFTAVFRDEF